MRRGRTRRGFRCLTTAAVVALLFAYGYSAYHKEDFARLSLGRHLVFIVGGRVAVWHMPPGSRVMGPICIEWSWKWESEQCRILGHLLYIPLWVFLFPSAIATASAWWPTRPSPGLCPTCRYNLTGLPASSLCPECGQSPATQ